MARSRVHDPTCRSRETAAARACAGLSILIAVALALRLLAGPAFAAPPVPGLVPICAGGQIVYVALEGYGGPEDPAPEHGPDPCPWMGLGPLLGAVEPPALPVAVAAAAPQGPSAGPERLQAGRAAGYRPRAPPEHARG